MENAQHIPAKECTIRRLSNERQNLSADPSFVCK